MSMQSILGIGILVIVIMAAALLAVGLIDGNRFVTVKEEFCLAGLTKECRFVLISDLHNKVYGKNNDKVMEAVRKINPDFIILAGDLVTSKASEDMTPGIELVKDKNVFLLDNTSVDIPEYQIRVTGLDLDLKYFAHFRIRKMEDGYLQKTLPKYDKSKCNILIAHNPDYFEQYARWGADLVLSGHVHGGIMRLPFLGGVIAPSYKIFPKYDGGVFKSENATMLLGRGMGSHTIPLRFFNPAELYDVTLKTKCE